MEVAQVPTVPTAIAPVCLSEPASGWCEMSVMTSWRKRKKPEYDLRMSRPCVWCSCTTFQDSLI